MDAAGDDIGPNLSAALNGRYDVIQRQSTLSGLLATVLADVLISNKDITARKTNNLATPPRRNVTKQAKDTGNTDRDADTAYNTIGFLDDLNLALEEHLQGLLPRNDANGFKTRVEYQRVPGHIDIIEKLTITRQGRG